MTSIYLLLLPSLWSHPSILVSFSCLLANMSVKITAVNSAPTVVVVVREYDEEEDKVGVEEMERRCEIGEGGKPSLVADLLGDPICRVRHFPSHVMLVYMLCRLIPLLLILYIHECSKFSIWKLWLLHDYFSALMPLCLGGWKTGSGIWRWKRDSRSYKRVYKNCDRREFTWCKVSLYSGFKGFSFPQVHIIHAYIYIFMVAENIKIIIIFW